jgi:hypothetical protein
MTYTVSYMRPRNLQAVERFLLAFGKAVHLAARFESKCQFVLRVGRGALFSATPGTDLLSYLMTLKDDPLARTIAELARLGACNEEGVRLLDDARKARNELVHGAGDLGTVYDLSDRRLSMAQDELAARVERLIPGDAMVSRWLHEIEEKEPPDALTVRLYATAVRHWVFGEPDVVKEFAAMLAERGIELPAGYEW